jgi:dTDP-4-dehydrorhamnose reductase
VRILLTGVNGQVGWELQRALAPLGEVIAADRGMARGDTARQQASERITQVLAISNPDKLTAV